MLRRIPKILPLRIRLFRVTPRNFFSKTSKKFNELKFTWYQVLGVSEKATPMEIEEAFHEKLTSTDDLASKTDSAEVDAALEQSLKYMDAYQVLSHPSKRIDYDTRLRMYRRGDKRAENHGTDRRVRTGAFLSVEKELKENEPVDKSLTKKADEMIGQFYKESTHMPTIGGDKLYLKENITHNVKLKEADKSDRRQMLETELSDLQKSHKSTSQALHTDTEGSKKLLDLSHRMMGAMVLFVLALVWYNSYSNKREKEKNASEFDSAYEAQIKALSKKTSE